MNDQSERERIRHLQPTDRLAPDVPPDPPRAAGTADAGTGLRRPDESDAYGLDVKGPGDVVQSDVVAAAELTSEYTAAQAGDDTRARADEAREAWHEAAKDSTEGRR